MKAYIKNVSLIMALLLTAALFCTVPAHAESEYTLFVNDEPWYTETLYGWQKINQVYYVPISVFLKVDGVGISTNSENTTTTIKYRDKYIDIDIKEKRFAYAKEYGEFYFKTYNLRSGLLFVPAITVCSYFGFSLDIFDGERAIRICDGNQKLSFYEVLLLYNTDMVLRRTDKTSDPFGTGSATSYFMFDMERGDSENALRISGLLEKYGAKGTFFADKDTMLGSAPALRSMIVSGNAIGILSDDGVRDAEELIKNADEANEILYACTKTKTRVIRLSDGCGFRPDGEDTEKILRSGYILWGYDLDSADVRYSSAESAVRGFVNSASDRISFAARFHCKNITVGTLDTLIRFYMENEGYRILPSDGTKLFPQDALQAGNGG